MILETEVDLLGAGFENPAAAETSFYAAFATIDLSMMDRVWLDDDTASCIHPGGGLLQGKQRIMQSWMEIFGGATQPDVEHRLLNTIAGSDIAVHLVEEAIRPGGDKSADPSQILATNIYVRRGEGWYLAEHHASLPMMQPRAAKDRRLMH